MTTWQCPSCGKTFKLKGRSKSGKVKLRCASCGFTTTLVMSASDETSQAASGDGWFQKIGGTSLGPFSLSRLRQMISTKALTPEDLLRHGRTGDWIPAARVPQLAQEWERGQQESRVERKPVEVRRQTMLDKLAARATRWLGSPRRYSHVTQSGRKPGDIKGIVLEGAGEMAKLGLTYLRAAKVGAGARNGREALAAMDRMSSILEDGGPIGAEFAGQLRTLRSVSDETSALQHCWGIAETLANTAATMPGVISELKGIADEM